MFGTPFDLCGRQTAARRRQRVRFAAHHFYNQLLLLAMKRFVQLLPLLLALLIAASAQAQDKSADAVLKRLRQKYRAVDALRAKFTQATRSSYADSEQRFSGEVVLRGKKFRVETGTRTLVTNGKTTWIYTPSENQVLVNDYKPDETTFSLNDFLFNFEENYEVESVESVRYDGLPHYQLRLHPKQDDTFFQDLTLWMRKQDALVTRLDVTDLNDTRMTYTLDDIELNPTISGRTFTFSPPEDAKVVDLRS
jgi:outer membrane lipoprotein carrier protein